MKMLIMILAGLAAGVTASKANAMCPEGSFRNCTTANGCSGEQECNGSGWGLCEPPAPPVNCTMANGCPGNRECLGAPCKPVLGTKSCTVCGGPGTQQCNANGIAGACIRPEECNQCDDDADGEVDECLPFCGCPDNGLKVECHRLCTPEVSPNFIGVIPESSCPVNAELVSIHMDDEDWLNGDSHSGWKGATVSNQNTIFKFCRVDSRDFRPLTTSIEQSKNYAVLMLDSTCPKNSQKFSRTFDNEDTSNDNWSLGPVGLNSSTKSPSTTTLHFCLFRSAASEETMSSFPDIGENKHYGVFAAPGFALSLSAGVIHTDDEDWFNANSFSAPAAILDDSRKIVGDGPNTTLRVAKVR